MMEIHTLSFSKSLKTRTESWILYSQMRVLPFIVPCTLLLIWLNFFKVFRVFELLRCVIVKGYSCFSSFWNSFLWEIFHLSSSISEKASPLLFEYELWWCEDCHDIHTFFIESSPPIIKISSSFLHNSKHLPKNTWRYNLRLRGLGHLWGWCFFCLWGFSNGFKCLSSHDDSFANSCFLEMLKILRESPWYFSIFPYDIIFRNSNNQTDFWNQIISTYLLKVFVHHQIFVFLSCLSFSFPSFSWSLDGSQTSHEPSDQP